MHSIEDETALEDFPVSINGKAFVYLVHASAKQFQETFLKFIEDPNHLDEIVKHKCSFTLKEIQFLSHNKNRWRCRRFQSWLYKQILIQYFRI